MTSAESTNKPSIGLVVPKISPWKNIRESNLTKPLSSHDRSVRNLYIFWCRTHKQHVSEGVCHRFQYSLMNTVYIRVCQKTLFSSDQFETPGELSFGMDY